jgi:hypothetical protein
MKKNLLCTLAVVLLTCEAQAVLIGGWTFETSPPADVTGATIGGILADSGTGTASGVHASASTAWSTPSGNGSANSLSSNNWAVNDYYQFQISTVGFEDIIVSWDHARSSTGPGTFDFAYSVDNGTTFTVGLNDYTVGVSTSPTAWNGTTGFPAYSNSVNLSSVTALDQAPSVLFRLIAVAAPSAATGTNRVDNFAVNGSIAAIPEPSAYLFGALATMLGGGAMFGRRLFARS